MTENSPSSSEPSQESDGERAAPTTATPASASASASAEAAPTPARVPLPGWAWALIAVAIIVFLASAATTTIIVTSALASAGSYECDEFGECSGSDATKARPEPTSSGSDRPAVDVHVPLDRSAVFEGQPVWSIAPGATWQPTTFDRAGINVLQDEATGCQLATTQRLALPDPDVSDDFDGSYAVLVREFTAFLEEDPDAQLHDPGLLDIAIAEVGSDSTIEFASVTISHINPDGVAQITELAARSMLGSESELVARLTCDAPVHNAFTAQFEVFSEVLSVTTTP